MLNMILKWIIYALIIIFIAWVIPGITVSNFGSALIACIVLAIINIFIKPLLEFISLPINFLTFGIFSLVINAIMLTFAGRITPGFQVEGFLAAFLGSILLALLSSVVERIEPQPKA